ncbi:MAG: TraB/GumN family protein [Nitrospirota bacterium]
MLWQPNLSECPKKWGKIMESLITRSSTEDRRMSSIYEKLIYERNRNMVSKIEDFLKTKETYFIVAGAGHLVGNKGIIEMLRNKGYNVEQKEKRIFQ